MVTYCVTKIPTCSPMIGQFFWQAGGAAGQAAYAKYSKYSWVSGGILALQATRVLAPREWISLQLIQTTKEMKLQTVRSFLKLVAQQLFPGSLHWSVFTHHEVGMESFVKLGEVFYIHWRNARWRSGLAKITCWNLPLVNSRSLKWPRWMISLVYIITKSMRALWLVNQLWFIIPVN